MPRSRTYRFAVGNEARPDSSVWRLVAQGEEVYIGNSRDSMGLVKLSLHSSGVWVFATTQQATGVSGAKNRRLQRWSKPSEHAAGIVRGPSIVVPSTSQGVRRIPRSELRKAVSWVPYPGPGKTAEFTIYFSAPGAKVVPATNEVSLFDHTFPSQARMHLFATSRETPAAFGRTVEGLLKNNPFHHHADAEIISGALLWLAESADSLRTPFIVDLPLPLVVRGQSGDAS